MADEATHSPRTVFITGAGRGIGHEAARRLLEAGQRVVISDLDDQVGAAAAVELGARFVPLDVTSSSDAASAARDVAGHEGRIDTLINNAGILGRRAPLGELTADDAEKVFQTNLFGIVRVVHYFLPLLRKSQEPLIVNVSSGVGSFSATHDPNRIESGIVSPFYAASKAAVLMLTSQYAKALPDIRVNAADPGFTATAFTNFAGTQTVTEGTDAIVQLATEDASAGTGRFINRFGPASW
jgi:NAD(P)-dependent dehydrogenase (short-subunit alcohol dehydrogenase family)